MGIVKVRSQESLGRPKNGEEAVSTVVERASKTSELPRHDCVRLSSELSNEELQWLSHRRLGVVPTKSLRLGRSLPRCLIA